MQEATKVRKVTAGSYSEALRLIKESMGSDAVILSNRMVDPEPGDELGAPRVELTAAMGDVAANFMLHSAPNRRREHRGGLVSFSRGGTDADLLKPFRRRLLEEEVRERLVNQILEGVARRVLQDGPRGISRALDFLLMEIGDRVRIYQPPRARGYARLTAMVGTSGVGKSTLLAKVAATEALRDRRRVALISVGRRGSGRDLLRMTSGIIECPLREADTPENLAGVLNELVGFDHIFLDVRGVSPFDEQGLERLNALLAAAPEVECHLVLNASTRDVDMLKAFEAFASLKPRALAFARLDEASCYGALLNSLDSARLPLSYFGFGRDVPADLEEASTERVLDLLLDLSTQGENGIGG